MPIRIHKCTDLVVCDPFPTLRTSVKLYSHTRGRGMTYLLKCAGKLLQQLNATCFELSGKKTPRTVILIEFASESISGLYAVTNSPLQFGHIPRRHQGKSPDTGN